LSMEDLEGKGAFVRRAVRVFVVSEGPFVM